MENQLKLAEQQLIGFAHATRGYSIKMLADSMGLTKEEWVKLKDSIDLQPLDKEDLDEKYNITNK